MFRTSLVLAWLLAGAACSEPAPPRTHVVLVLVDQLRADALAPWMPETSALAREGVTLTHMRTAAPWTYPSVISLLSGLYPHQHGADSKDDQLSHISPDVPLLPRTLGAAGYHSAAFVTNPFLHAWNTEFQGSFDHCDASFIGDQGARRGHPELVWTERMYASTVNEHVRAFYDGRALDAPEFTYVHYIDVHGRKEGPEQWRDAPFEPGYANAARFVDGKIAELYRYFSARYGGKLLFVVTSDHGQNLGDDLLVGEGRPWRWRKASMHDFNLRIPFLVLPGEGVPRGLVLEAPLSNVDVTPTLLEWLGLAGHDGVPGQSFLGLLRGGSAPPERALYARNSTNGRVEEALLVGQHKLVRYDIRAGDRELEKTACFDLVQDPRELAAQACSSLELEALDGLVGSLGRSYPATYRSADAETLEQLDDLGYGGDEPASPKDADRTNDEK